MRTTPNPTPRTGIVLLAALVVWLGATPLSRAQALVPSLAGNWRLTEQYYGTGGHNFVDDDEPYRLELRLHGGRIAGTATLSGRSAEWPAYFGPDGPRPLQDVSVVPEVDGLGTVATFRVPPGAGDDTWLFVTETLRAGPDGRLVATLTVEFERKGERKGAFTWRRVFVREDGP